MSFVNFAAAVFQIPFAKPKTQSATTTCYQILVIISRTESQHTLKCAVASLLSGTRKGPVKWCLEGVHRIWYSSTRTCVCMMCTLFTPHLQTLTICWFSTLQPIVSVVYARVFYACLSSSSSSGLILCLSAPARL